MSTEHLPTASGSHAAMMAPRVGWPSIDLNSGDEMTREEFHRIYEQTPEDFKAELIGGIVYVASPL